MTSRPLTDGEIKLAKTVFGDSIDYTTVKVHDSRYAIFQPKGTAMAPDGNLYMYGCHCADYSVEAPYRRSHFIHEMTHVWQYQNRVLNPVVAAVELSLKHRFNYFSAAYAYHLDEKKDLTDYGMEEQATIVQEYFLTKREGVSPYSRHCQNTCDTTEKLRLFEKVLEKFLANPAYAKRDKFPAPFKKPKP